ncbi:MAG: hydroxymethylbilane synthase [Polyangia bacterium]
MTDLRIATRGSQLALWQAEHVRSLLQAQAPELVISLLVLKTQGDRTLDRPLSEIGGKGLFTKEIEEALLDRRADLAVHSMKDLPSELPPGLVLGAIPPREDPADALVLAPGHRPRQTATPEGGHDAAALLRSLPAGARVGTSSLRRACQLRRLRPDLDLVALRGNVDTRLRRIERGELDAAVLAAAGLCRLGLAHHIAARFTPAQMLPACGQGALGLECRADDTALLARLERLADAAATAAVLAERAFSLRLGGSCHTPLGGHARVLGLAGGSELILEGLVGSPDGQEVLRAERRGPVTAPAELGRQLGETLLAAGAERLLTRPDPLGAARPAARVAG